MFRSHILKYRVGIISMIVVMTCMIICSVLFDVPESGETTSAVDSENTDAYVDASANTDNGDKIVGKSSGFTAVVANIKTEPDAGLNSDGDQTDGQLMSQPQQTDTDCEDEPVVVSDGEFTEQVVGEVLSQYEVMMIGEDDEEITLDINEVEFLPIYNLGTRDDSVAVIQSKLMDLGFMDPAEPTDYYGSITMDAVKRFQRQNDLKQDGIMGQETIAMILDPGAKSYLLKKGMEGDDVELIQTRLYELGYLEKKSLITGSFGSETESAVRALQQANGLTADGLIGSATTELLYYGDVKANLLSFGDKNDIILECQNKLKDLGYMTTSPDGLYGGDTLAAVKLFQSRNDLVVDGYLGPTTREKLMSSSAIPNGLVIGDEGDTVKRVQEILIKLGYLAKGSATGYFGDVTDKAVKSFQKNNGLYADGNVGRKTMAVLTGGNGKTSSGTSSGSVETGSANGGSVKSLLKVALSKLGCPYKYGAKGPDKFDCSGFVYWCLNQVGVKQSYITSYQWRTIGKYKKITSYSSLKAGDIIVVTGHVGIIGEDGTVIDASSSRQQIMHRKLSSWWSNRFICGWRIF